MRNLLFTSIAAFMMLFAFPSTELRAQDAGKGVKLTANVQVLQFHSDHRCKTCLKIESMTTETLSNYPDVPFRLVNVDDEANAKVAEQFGATGTALVIYDGKKGKKIDLTDFAFMNAHDAAKFESGLRKNLDSLLK
jgi:hypothetical protein